MRCFINAWVWLKFGGCLFPVTWPHPGACLVGIALATSIAAWVNVLLLWRGLKGFVSLRRENWRRLGGMLAASLVMAAGLYGAREMMGTWLAGEFWTKLIATSLLISFGATVYSLGVIKLRVTSVAELKKAFKK